MDTHTGGTPTRIVHDPLLFGIPGRTMAAKQEALEKDFGFGRRAITAQVSYPVFVTGLHRFLINNRDPLREGYLLSARGRPTKG